jgi:hypothetical protein
MPPVLDWSGRAREAFDAAGPAMTCRLLHILRERMAGRPVRVDGPGATLDDLQSGDWERIAHVTFERTPPTPLPSGTVVGPDVTERLKPRFHLCADVPKHKRLACASISDEGTAPLFVARAR